jgi:adenylate cyclase
VTDPLARKEREIRVVREVAATVNATLELDLVLARILDVMRDSFGFTHCLVLLARPDGTLVVRRSLGYPGDGGLGVEVKPGEGVIGVVAKRRKTMRMASVVSKQRYSAMSGVASGAPVARLPGLPNVQSTVAVPMLAGDQLIGVFAVESDQPLTFDPDDERLIETVANMAGAAIRNAALYHDLVASHRSSERFVPHAFVRFLEKRSLLELHRGDSVRKQMTVLFSDIRGFTSVVEGLDPAATFELLNAYFASMVPPIQDHGGFVDKFIGDAIMALFDEGHADAAFRAAIASHKALDALNAARTGLTPLGMGVGLHTGPLTLGAVGSPDRLACTVYGDSVNLASRVEGLTRLYGTRLLVTEASVEALHDPSAFRLRPVDRVRVKGKEAPVGLVEVLDALTDAERAARAPSEALRDAMTAYQAGRFDPGPWSALAEAWPDDPLPRVFLARCAAFVASPPVAWDGVFRLSEK